MHADRHEYTPFPDFLQDNHALRTAPSAGDVGIGRWARMQASKRGL